MFMFTIAGTVKNGASESRNSCIYSTTSGVVKNMTSLPVESKSASTSEID